MILKLIPTKLCIFPSQDVCSLKKKKEKKKREKSQDVSKISEAINSNTAEAYAWERA